MTGLAIQSSAMLYFAFPALSRDVDLLLSKHSSTFSKRGVFWLSPNFRWHRIDNTEESVILIFQLPRLEGVELSGSIAQTFHLNPAFSQCCPHSQQVTTLNLWKQTSPWQLNRIRRSSLLRRGCSSMERFGPNHHSCLRAFDCIIGSYSHQSSSTRLMAASLI